MIILIIFIIILITIIFLLLIISHLIKLLLQLHSIFNGLFHAFLPFFVKLLINRSPQGKLDADEPQGYLLEE